jgi:NAD(P)-dependent dehydrogenase (short-subunit alcohol dehydrogenase family)
VGEKTPHVNFSLQGKSALITGAARGIGRAICWALAAAGADVMGLDICAVAAPNLTYPPATSDDLDAVGKATEDSPDDCRKSGCAVSFCRQNWLAAVV